MKSLKLSDENLYYIGGVVRDELLGKISFDIDLTYEGNAIDFCKDMSNSIGKILQINEPFGTVRMLIDNTEVDIASTRDEIYEKKGHLPTVSNIGCSLKKDVLRRDFTINALAKSTKTGEIIDYTGGIKDIENKTLRILHDKSFIDDPTRILRGLKFSVRFGFELDEHTKKLQDDYLKNVNYDMSYKRLKKEITETFNLNSQKAFEKFIDEKIYRLITPNEINPPKYDIEALVKKYLKGTDDETGTNTWLIYVGWIDGIKNLPLTKEEQKIVDDYNSLINSEIKDDDYSIYKTFENKSKEAVLLYTIMTNSEKGLRYFEIENITTELNGNDLKSLGIAPSNKYSECFDYILKKKLENPDLTKSEEIELAKKYFC